MQYIMQINTVGMK